MRIRIIKEPPILKRHGVTVGREFETCAAPEGWDEYKTWIVGEAAERLGLRPDEFEEMGDYGNKGTPHSITTPTLTPEKRVELRTRAIAQGYPDTIPLLATINELETDLAIATQRAEKAERQAERYALSESGAVNSEIHARSEELSERQRADALEADNTCLRTLLTAERKNMALALEIKRRLYTKVDELEKNAALVKGNDGG